MEILQFYVPILSAFLVFLFMFPKNRKFSKLRLPPGPRKLPYIGNLHQLTGSLPHRSLQALTKIYGPVMHLKLGEVSALVISSPEAAKEVMKNQDLNFADRPMISSIEVRSYKGKGIAFSPYGEYWRQLRKICTLELLTSKRVQLFRSLREEEVNNLIKSISSFEGAPINLSKMIATFTNSVICKVVFGKKCDDKDVFLSAIKEGTKLSGGFDVSDIYPSYTFLHHFSRGKTALEKLCVRLDEILSKIVDNQKIRIRESRLIGSTPGSSDQEDLVDFLLKVQERSDIDLPITTDDIKAVILDIFASRGETSATIMEWAMSELIRNPPIMEKAQAEVRDVLKEKSTVDETDIQEMNYLKLVIKETLRLHAPLPLLLPRESREKCKVNDYDIPIKTKVIVNAWAIGRDPDNWGNPELFDPDRFDGSPLDFKGTNFEYIPFGAGRRMCPGISFGIANIELPLAQLLYSFNWKLANGKKPEQLDMNEEFRVTLARKNELILIATPYTP